MANHVVSDDKSPVDTPSSGSSGFKEMLVRLLTPLASLKITVVLLAMAIFIVLAGTFAQWKMGNWDAVDKYFRCGVTFVEFDAFQPRAFFPNRLDESLEILGLRGFYFPGGWLIGTLMAINLACAHGLRFKVQAKGSRLTAGLGVLGIGVLATWLVVVSGGNSDGVQVQITDGLVKYLWLAFVASLVAGWLATAFQLSKVDRKQKSIEWWSLVIVAIGLTGVLAYFFTNWESAQLSKPSMRILWQLVKGTLASLMLLAGCIMLFKKRAGVVLLHSGIGLLMVSELMVGMSAVEGQMQILEGKTINFTMDNREVELAFVDESGKEENVHIAVPESRLETTSAIEGKALPFIVKPLRFYKHSSLRRLAPGEKTDATQDLGTQITVDKEDASTGVDNKVDIASVFVELKAKEGGKSLGVWMFSQHVRTQTVTVDGKNYTAELRYKRSYKPYSIHLRDVRKNDYIGTATPRDYSAYVRMVDSETRFDRDDIRIWMNNPFRYRGETFYQSGYDTMQETITDPATGRPVFDPATGRPKTRTTELTVLQVVTNSGWMLPYVCCMIVGTGMLSVFMTTLLRFLDRRTRETARLQNETSNTTSPAGESADSPEPAREWGPLMAPIVAVVVAAAFVGMMARPQKSASDELALEQVGKIPVADKGRVKPLDSLARDSLVVISKRQSFHPRAAKSDDDKKGLSARPNLEKKSQSALVWLLDLISGKEGAEHHEVFRIESLDLLDLMKLNPRPQWWRYSLADLRPRMTKLNEEVARIKKTDDKRWSTEERRAVSLYSNIQKIFGVKSAFLDVNSSKSLSRMLPAEMQRDTEIEPTTYFLYVLNAARNLKQVTFGVPTGSGDDPWEPYTIAVAREWMKDFAAEHEATDLDTFADAFVAEMKRDGTFKTRVEQGVETFVERQMIQGLAAFLASQKEGMSNDEAVKMAIETLPNMPEDVRNSLEQAHRERINESRDIVEATIAQGITDELKDGIPIALGEFAIDEPPRKPARAMMAVLDAYREGDVKAFNAAVAAYRTDLFDEPPKEYVASKTRFEAYMNNFAPFFWSQWLYLLAFVLAATAWLKWTGPLNRASFWLLLFVFALHTFAMMGRIYISGRPPVTNLYSSAVFIGLACVALGLVFEAVYRSGIGNVVASVTGFMGTGIGFFLAREGDTYEVMQAVLDSQFWLTTHVVCITLGYATTFLAGGLGVIYILRGVCTPSLDAGTGKSLSQMMYGTLCFATFLSFVGTVLGGLWADDSWGRFWGWDTKENGALIIVLWNALVLHARWGRMAGDRGLALLVVGGNIATSWSWFGTNELGVGLHAYGFTEGRLLSLVLFVALQLAIIALGAVIPHESWWSTRRQRADKAVS
jgi:ABC-type transport system involved in cytochrome c biogenesis permease subunit